MYLPDYRKETDKLNEVDTAAIDGFRLAVKSAMCLFGEIADDEDTLSIEKEIAAKIKARFEEWMEFGEIEFVCSLFDNADYLPDDIKLVDDKARRIIETP
jgi:hypothetical protein